MVLDFFHSAATVQPGASGGSDCKGNSCEDSENVPTSNILPASDDSGRACREEKAERSTPSCQATAVSSSRQVVFARQCISARYGQRRVSRERRFPLSKA